MSARRPRVLWSVAALRPDDNPYLHELADGVRVDADLNFLDARAALTATPDVFHVHWPHQLYRAANRPKALVKAALSSLLLRRLRRRGVPVVLTVHNRRSHEPENARERRILRLLERAVTVRILLGDYPGDDPDGAVVIRHPHYRAWLRARGVDPDVAVPPGRDVVLFGMLRPYKGIEALSAAAGAAGVTATITGSPVDAAYAETLTASAPAGVVVDPRRLDDAELVRTIRAHRLVCLPYPAMYNSGALLYALSVGRPVLVPRTDSTDAIAGEVGEEWVLRYDGDLTADILRRALDAADALTGAPRLALRDPRDAAAQHLALYRSLAARPDPQRR